MAAKATPPRLHPCMGPPAPRRRTPKLVTLRLRLADLEDRAVTDQQIGALVRTVAMAQAYGTVSPALLTMRLGIPREDAQRMLNHFTTAGSLQPAQVTGSTL